MTSMTKQMQMMFRVDGEHNWLRDADITYCAARHLLFAEDVFFRSPVGYLFHQAVEKYLKTLRKILLPGVKERQGNHDLYKVYADVIGKIRAIDKLEIRKAIEGLNTFQYWRYQDMPSKKTRRVMFDGLVNTDLVVATVRAEIPSEIRFQGLNRILQLEGTHRKLLLNALLTHNSQRDHWKSDLKGISPHVDKILEQSEAHEARSF